MIAQAANAAPGSQAAKHYPVIREEDPPEDEDGDDEDDNHEGYKDEHEELDDGVDNPNDEDGCGSKTDMMKTKPCIYKLIILPTRTFASCTRNCSAT